MQDRIPAVMMRGGTSKGCFFMKTICLLIRRSGIA